jgi:hypothetical protein
MKIQEIERYFLNTEHDISSAGILVEDDKFLFIIQPKNRWCMEDNRTMVPFGGIGGKLELGETTIAALKREVKEEIDVDVEIIKTDKSTELTNFRYKGSKLLKFDQKEGSPIFIHRNKNTEKGRRKHTAIFIYLIKIKKGEISPIDNPAIIKVPISLVGRLVKGKTNIAEAISLGVEIESRINLPKNGMLFPTPTPKIIAKRLSTIKQLL